MNNHTWFLRGCPRCGGDMYKSFDGEYFERQVKKCLQCGYAEDIMPEPKFETAQPELQLAFAKG